MAEPPQVSSRACLNSVKMKLLHLHLTPVLSPVTLQALFYDYMTALATHVNVFTGLQYRHDPALLGWDLAHKPRNPGSMAGEKLQVSFAGLVGAVQLKWHTQSMRQYCNSLARPRAVLVSCVFVCVTVQQRPFPSSECLGVWRG